MIEVGDKAGAFRGMGARFSTKLICFVGKCSGTQTASGIYNADGDMNTINVIRGEG